MTYFNISKEMFELIQTFNLPEIEFPINISTICAFKEDI